VEAGHLGVSIARYQLLSLYTAARIFSTETSSEGTACRTEPRSEKLLAKRVVAGDESEIPDEAASTGLDKLDLPPDFFQ